MECPFSLVTLTKRPPNGDGVQARYCPTTRPYGPQASQTVTDHLALSLSSQVHRVSSTTQTLFKFLERFANQVRNNVFYRMASYHDDVIKWKHFPRYWPFVRGIHRPPVNSLPKGQWRGVLMFSLICVWINGSVNNREAGDLRRYRAHYDVTVVIS